VPEAPLGQPRKENVLVMDETMRRSEILKSRLHGRGERLKWLGIRLGSWAVARMIFIAGNPRAMVMLPFLKRFESTGDAAMTSPQFCWNQN
jgi:hypothetical protein